MLLHRFKTFSLLDNGVFRRPWFAHQISDFAGSVRIVGAAWMMMMALIRSGSTVRLVQTAGAAPIIPLSLISGVMEDIYNRP
ncbi:MFS transporter [Bradyrhizobium barranii]|uniref:MFS transporter n=1 Tax=Bradyrhizobium barranii TaxID=2992140 RepID=UPI003D15FC96